MCVVSDHSATSPFLFILFYFIYLLFLGILLIMENFDVHGKRFRYGGLCYTALVYDE